MNAGGTMRGRRQQAVIGALALMALIFVGGVLGGAGTLVMIFSRYQFVPSALLDPLAAALNVPHLAVQAMFVGFLIGLGFGAFLSVDWAFITDVIPRDQAGLFMGFSNIATAGAGIIARFVAGFLLDAFNARGNILGLPGGYPVIFTVFFVWMIAGSVLVLKVRESRAEVEKSPSTRPR